jgi:hypothetical protein
VDYPISTTYNGSASIPDVVETDMRSKIGLGILLIAFAFLSGSATIPATAKTALVKAAGASKKGPAYDALRRKCADQVAEVTPRQRRAAKLRCIEDGKKKL